MNPRTASGAQGEQPRYFLFVTAPFGPFSRHLAKALREGGARCERVLLNLGDMLEWGRPHSVAYQGTREAWPAWIARYLAEAGVTDLICHGDSQDYAIDAIRAARVQGLNIHVFEQGYFRPHWITLERDGVNAHSSLPRSPDAYSALAKAPVGERITPVGRITPAAVWHISIYHFVTFLTRGLFFPRYRDPYEFPPWKQACGHTGRYFLQLFRRLLGSRRHVPMADGGPNFLALLQRPGDSQITRHSPFSSVEDFIGQVTESFARHAPPEALLTFKAHPLDHGLEGHRQLVEQTAAQAGVAGRVRFVDDGHFPSMLAKAAGVLSINSTGGLSSLEAGLPTLVLGEAIYDLPGLTHQGGMDAFWLQPEAPDREFFETYRAGVMGATQINGAFSTLHGVRLAVPEAARRLLAPPRP